jgi:hypothetical protein
MDPPYPAAVLKVQPHLAQRQQVNNWLQAQVEVAKGQAQIKKYPLRPAQKDLVQQLMGQPQVVAHLKPQDQALLALAKQPALPDKNLLL